jgi:hypothetical protein
MKIKKLIPSDFRDFLSIISAVGFLAIFMAFTLDITWLSENMTAIFLILGGSSFLVIGKAFSIGRWARDGIQQNEVSRLISIVFGLSAMVIGFIFLSPYEIPIRLYGYIGFLALVPMIYTIIDYLFKNV